MAARIVSSFPTTYTLSNCDSILTLTTFDHSRHFGCVLVRCLMPCLRYRRTISSPRGTRREASCVFVTMSHKLAPRSSWIRPKWQEQCQRTLPAVLWSRFVHWHQRWRENAKVRLYRVQHAQCKINKSTWEDFSGRVPQARPWVPTPERGSHFAGHMEIQAVAHSHRTGLSILGLGGERHEMLRNTMEESQYVVICACFQEPLQELLWLWHICRSLDVFKKLCYGNLNTIERSSP